MWLLSTLVGMTMLMAGCGDINKPITEKSTGFWNEYFVYPLSWLIKEVSALFDPVNYGIGIILVTIIVRLAILPLMLKQIRSSKAMQALQPEMKALREKYSSKDMETQQKLQQETMALFQKHGVNPLAGCLPIFIQMPILIAFYHAISRTFEIKNHEFLWFNLGHPDYVLPILTMITQFISQKLSMTGMDDNPQMKMMLYIMPVMVGFFAFNFPAALSLYWVVGNLFMIVQTLVIKGPKLDK